MWEQLFAFVGAAVLLTCSPGPDIIYVLSQSVTNGKKAGILTALGLVLGVLIHTTLIAFGFSLLIRENEILFTIIKVVGALYLCYLAFQAYRSEDSLQTKTLQPVQSRKFILRGFIMNVINPKVILFFLAFFPGFLWNTEDQIITQFYILGGLFMLQAFIIFGAISFLGEKINRFLKRKKHINQTFKWMQILVYLGIGVFILF